MLWRFTETAPSRIARIGGGEAVCRAVEGEFRFRRYLPNPSLTRHHHGCDSAFDNNRAVISTIGITRSYAIRVGPITPSVPTMRPLDS